MNADLAIIIPAWKPDYLEEAVNSVLNQTSRRYNLYVFDDNSPHDIKKILDKSDKTGSVHYHRFDKNMGQKSLVKHWNRCVSHTKGEEWIWLFSDDDLMDPGCVEAFHKAKESCPGRPAYRFSSKKISDDGTVIRENQFPAEFDAVDFLNIKLSYSQESYVVEYIFSRKTYNQVGGFPELPLAWAADDLFITKLAGYGRLKSISGPAVHWRYSGKNISAQKSSKSAPLKMEASFHFVTWIMENKKIADKLTPGDLPVRWYIRQIRTLEGQLTLLQECRAVFRLGRFTPSVWKHYITLKKDRSKIIGWLKRFSS